MTETIRPEGAKIEQVIPSQEQEENYAAAKTFAKAILGHMKGYESEELNSGVNEIETTNKDWLDDKSWTFAERKGKLVDKIRKMNLVTIFRREEAFDFAVHRRFQGGKYINAPDFDGALSLWLLGKAGADTSKIKYAYPGEKPPKDKFSIDFGNEFGVIPPEDEGDRTVVVDHHITDIEAAFKNGLTLKEILGTCSSKFIFEGLEGCGLFDGTDETGERLDAEALRKMAELATMVDNKKYPHDPKTFENSWQTVLGLYQHMKLEDIYNYFRMGGTATSKIQHKESETEEEKTLIDQIESNLTHKQGDKIVSLPEKRQQMIKDAEERVKRLEADGYVVEVLNQQGKKLKFLVDYIHEEMPLERKRLGTSLRTDAAFAAGFDGVILYNQETKSIFVNIDPLTEDTISLDVDSLVNVRGKMIVTDALRRNYMNISLKSLIEKLGGNPRTIGGRLHQALETNIDWVKNQKRPEGKEQHRALTIFFGEKGWSAILPGNLIIPLPETADGYDSRFLYNIEIENLPEGGLQVIKVEKTNQMAEEPELPPETEE